MRRHSFRLALAAVAALACAPHAPQTVNHSERPPARYLFAWAGDEDREDSDFLAVIDLARDGDRYGTIVATTPIVVALTYMPIPTWHPLRPSIAHDHAGNQVQVYRLSDLALLKTIKLPTNDGPNEPRVLQDGRTVLVNTGACRLYHVAGLDGAEPRLEMVHREEQSGCAMPLVIGNYWIQSNAATHRVFSLDVRDLTNVRVISSVTFDERQRPHWLATDGSRIVVVNEPAPTAERRMWMLQLDRATGTLALDSAFRDAGSKRPGIAFDRASWPHGATGTAVPHGTVFGW